MKMKLQQDILDCGLVVVQAMHHYYYDNWIPINSLKEKVSFGTHGINVLELSNLAKQIGMLLEAFEGDFESLIKLAIKDPIISLINQNNTYHYVIITKIYKHNICYYDPVFGRVVVSHKKFNSFFQNIIIIPTKTSYQSAKKLENKKWFYIDYKIMTITIILSILSLFLSFISTFYIKIILDYIIPKAMTNGLNIITFAFVLIAFLRITSFLFKSIIIKKLENKINYFYLDLYFNKLYFCNISKLSKISKSDHLRRLATIQNIASFKANYIFIISSEATAFIFSSIILISISSKIFLVVAILSVLIISISFIFQKNINLKHPKILSSNLDFSTKTIDLVYSQLEMKQPIFRNIIQKNIDHSLKENFNINYKIFNLNLLHKTIMEIIKTTIPFVIIYISTKEIFNSSLKIGDMILFISIFSFFINPLDNFVNLLINVPIVKQDYELLEFILNLTEEKNNEGFIPKIFKKLSITDATFSYELGKELFNIKNFEVNSSLQISGKNGCGKSTFLKVLATYLSINGKYHLNDIDIDSYNLEALREKIYYCFENSYLPNISILQFLTNNEKNKIDQLQLAINKYHLQEIFDAFEIQLDNYIENNGDNFSSGQRQFILLLPLLVNEYELILLDESFENIDQNNFEKLSKLIKLIHQDKMFIEISHSKKYLYINQEINFEKFHKS